MFNYYYEGLAKRLAAVAIDDLAIDYYLGEAMFNEEDNLLYTTPIALIEFMPIDWATKGVSRIQQSTITFRVHLINETRYDDHNRISDDAIKHFQQESEIFDALHGWSCKLAYLDTFTNAPQDIKDVFLLNQITRIRTEPDHNLSPYIRSIQTFQCIVIDTTIIRDCVKVMLANIETNAQLVTTI